MLYLAQYDVYISVYMGDAKIVKNQIQLVEADSEEQALQILKKAVERGDPYGSEISVWEVEFGMILTKDILKETIEIG